MDVQVSKAKIYTLADILGMTVSIDYATKTLSGHANRELRLGKLTLPFKAQIVGSPFT